MRTFSKVVMTVAGASLLMGCVVREEPRHREVYREGPRAEVVYTEAPPEYVDEVTVSPGPEYVWVRGGYVREGDHWRLHRGYWNRNRR